MEYNCTITYFTNTRADLYLQSKNKNLSKSLLYQNVNEKI